jgi:hypothetical protein
MRRLRYANITARNVKYAAAFVLGLPEIYVEDVAMSDVSFYIDPHNTESGSPAMAPGVDGYCRAGVHLQHARRVRMHNVEVFDQQGPPLTVKECDDVRMDPS